MRTSILIPILGLATSLVAAQVMIRLPPCATDCVSKVFADTGCDLNDLGCACKNQEFITGVADCVLGNCDHKAVGETLEFAKDICLSVNIELPPSAIAAFESKTNEQPTAASNASTITKYSSPTSPSLSTPTSGAAGKLGTFDRLVLIATAMATLFL